MSDLLFRLSFFFKTRFPRVFATLLNVLLLVVALAGLYLLAQARERPPEYVEARIAVWSCPDVAEGGLLDAERVKECVHERTIFSSRLQPIELRLALPNSPRLAARQAIRNGSALVGEPFAAVGDEDLKGLVPIPVGEIGSVAKSDVVTRTFAGEKLPTALVADLLAGGGMATGSGAQPQPEAGAVGQPPTLSYITADVAFRCRFFSPGGDVCYAEVLGGALFAAGGRELVPIGKRDGAVLLAQLRADNPRPAQQPQPQQGGGLPVP
jgi:hypothetical protein